MDYIVSCSSLGTNLGCMCICLVLCDLNLLETPNVSQGWEGIYFPPTAKNDLCIVELASPEDYDLENILESSSL